MTATTDLYAALRRQGHDNTVEMLRDGKRPRIMRVRPRKGTGSYQRATAKNALRREAGL